MSAAVAVGMVVGTLASLAFQYYGMQQQEQQNRDIRQESRQMRGEDIARSERARRQELSFQKEKLRYEKGQAAKTWKWREEERDYSRAMDSVNRVTNFVDRGGEKSQRLFNMWSSLRRVA